jgi:hypothetical protein
MEETASSSVTYCKNPGCRRLLAQSGGGHRRREYCDDACRQAARRHRLEQAHRDEVARRWATFSLETRNFLDWLSTRANNGKELAEAVELAITCERDRATAACNAQYEEQLATLRDKQLARVEKLKARLAEVEQAAVQREPQRVLAGEQVGRQEHGVATDGFQQRIAELEREVANLQAAHAILAKNMEAAQQKLTQAAQRERKLEQQVDIQRRKLGQYHQRFYPSSLAVAKQRFMALGAALGYQRLLKYDAQAVGVGAGEQAWSDFATIATAEDLAQGMLQAQSLFENLCALGMVSNGELPVEALDLLRSLKSSYGPVLTEQVARILALVRDEAGKHRAEE